MKWLKGKKSYIGAALVAISAVLAHLGYADISKLVLTIGGSIGLIGIRNAIK